MEELAQPAQEVPGVPLIGQHPHDLRRGVHEHGQQVGNVQVQAEQCDLGGRTGRGRCRALRLLDRAPEPTEGDDVQRATDQQADRVDQDFQLENGLVVVSNLAWERNVQIIDFLVHPLGNVARVKRNTKNK